MGELFLKFQFRLKFWNAVFHLSHNAGLLFIHTLVCRTGSYTSLWCRLQQFLLTDRPRTTDTGPVYNDIFWGRNPNVFLWSIYHTEDQDDKAFSEMLRYYCYLFGSHAHNQELNSAQLIWKTQSWSDFFSKKKKAGVRLSSF